MTEQNERCPYAEFQGPLQLSKCTYEGKCDDKVLREEGYICSRTIIISREDVTKYSRSALEQPKKILR